MLAVEPGTLSGLWDCYPGEALICCDCLPYLSQLSAPPSSTGSSLTEV